MHECNGIKGMVLIHTIVQVGYTVLSTVLALGWYYAGTARQAGLVKHRQTQIHADPSLGYRHHRPQLTILIPTAGGRSRILQHWRALLSLQYSGIVRIVILVHSPDDPSFNIAQELLASAEGRVTVCITGDASSCSQKIHKFCSFNTGCANHTFHILACKVNSEKLYTLHTDAVLNFKCVTVQ